MKISKIFIILCIAFLSIPIYINASLPILKITSNQDDAIVYANDKQIGNCIDGKFEKEINPGRYMIILKTPDFDQDPILYSEFINAKMDNKIEVTAKLTLESAEEYYYKNINNYKDKKQFLKMFPRSKHFKKIENQIRELENQYDDDIATLKSKIRKKLNPKLILVSSFDKAITFTHRELLNKYYYMHEPISITFLYKDYPEIAKLDSFYLGKHEVTDKFYDFVMLIDQSLTNESTFIDNIDKIETYLADDIFIGYPKNNVTWFEATQFCNALSRIHNLTPVYQNLQERLEKEQMQGDFTTTDSYNDLRIASMNWQDFIFQIGRKRFFYEKEADGYRLPTLDEWVFASRGGNKTKGFTYSGSNNINQVAVFKDNSKGELAFVGSKNPNELGFYDMSGNVWEWVWDKYSGYERINRGGDYRNEEDVCRINNYKASYWRRDHNQPTHRSLGLGFRIARNKMD